MDCRTVGCVRKLLLLACACGASPEPEVAPEARSFAVHQPPTVLSLGVLDDPGTTPLYGAAARLAGAQMNEALQYLRADVAFQLAFGDDRGNTPAIARSEALRLLNDEAVIGFVSDSSGDTLQLNRLNYDPSFPAPYSFPVICYQCSSGFINDRNAVDADPITQQALRDADNWLYRLFYNANFEARVIDQLITNKPNQGDRDADGVLEIAIYADAGHVSLANAIGPSLSSYYTGPLSVETVFLSSTANLPAEWLRVVDAVNESTGEATGEPDYIVMAMLPVNVSAAVQAYRAGGYSLPVLSNNSFRRNYILPLIGPGANGLEGSSVALANDDVSGRLFTEAFTVANSGQGPEQTSSGAYDATVSLMLASLVAAAHAGDPALVTPSSVRDALSEINEPGGVKIRPSVASFMLAVVLTKLGAPINYEGAYSSGDWDAVGDIFPPLVHWSVDGDRFVELESYLCDPEHPLCPLE